MGILRTMRTMDSHTIKKDTHNFFMVTLVSLYKMNFIDPNIVNLHPQTGNLIHANPLRISSNKDYGSNSGKWGWAVHADKTTESDHYATLLASPDISTNPPIM